MNIEETIVYYGAPTLSGLKTASLFNVFSKDPHEVKKEAQRLNALLVPCGLLLCPLAMEKGRFLIYLYRPKRLMENLDREGCASILNQCGYPQDRRKCLAHLFSRLKGEGEFPHEIGLFLDYPVEDVTGFICQKGKGFKCMGCWKVYGDKEEAEKRFEQFKKCDISYRRTYQKNHSIRQLIVKE